MCPAHNTLCNAENTQLIWCCVEMQTVQSFIPNQHALGHVHLCCNSIVSDVFSFCPCPCAGCLCEAHNEQPMSSVPAIITLICSKLSHHFHPTDKKCWKITLLSLIVRPPSLHCSSPPHKHTLHLLPLISVIPAVCSSVSADGVPGL